MSLSGVPKHKLAQAGRIYLRQKYNQSLYLTAKCLLGYRDITEYTHGDMINALQSDDLRKLIVMPRGTFKSSIGVVSYPIWLLNRNPDLRILIDSEVFSNSKNFLAEIKGHLVNRRLTSIYGEYRTGDSTWRQDAITIAQRRRNLKEPSIQCSGIGAVKVGQHYDVIICDDMNSDKNSATEDGRKKVIQHYRMNLSILEPNGIYVVIGTRYAADDLIGHIMANEILGGDG